VFQAQHPFVSGGIGNEWLHVLPHYTFQLKNLFRYSQK
jgi:hypothetical protein